EPAVASMPLPVFIVIVEPAFAVRFGAVALRITPSAPDRLTVAPELSVAIAVPLRTMPSATDMVTVVIVSVAVEPLSVQMSVPPRDTLLPPGVVSSTVFSMGTPFIDPADTVTPFRVAWPFASMWTPSCVVSMIAPPLMLKTLPVPTELKPVGQWFAPPPTQVMVTSPGVASTHEPAPFDTPETLVAAPVRRLLTDDAGA